MSKTKEAAVRKSQELPRQQPMPRFDYQTPTTKLEVSIKTSSSSEKPRTSTEPHRFRSLQNLHF